MVKLAIGKVELGKRPVIAAVVDKVISCARLVELAEQGAEVVELRFDLLSLPVDEAVAYAVSIREYGCFGLLATCRETEANRGYRVDYLRAVMPYVDAVDEEVSSPDAEQVLALAAGKTRIVSHHDFQGTPDEAGLSEFAEVCFKKGGQIAKIATMARSNREVERIEAFSRFFKRPMISIAMGPLGADWRVRAFKAGSLLTYAFTGEHEVAPGQLGVPDLARRLSAAFPSFKQWMKKRTQ